MILSYFCPQLSANILALNSFVFTISWAEISISLAGPLAPPLGWWIITRACGCIKRRPFSPAESMMLPIDAANPVHIVETGLFIDCMVSYIENPLVTYPPGLLMYNLISSLFKESRYIKRSTTWRALLSFTIPHKNIVRSSNCWFSIFSWAFILFFIFYAPVSGYLFN